MANTSFPSEADKNSPFPLSNFKAFHSPGLWLAVIITPPEADNPTTANSTVGVVANPRSTTVIPSLLNVVETNKAISVPDFLASLPRTTFKGEALFLFTQVPYAAENLTISKGVRFSPGLPPIVPRIPEIDFISAIFPNCVCNLAKLITIPIQFAQLLISWGPRFRGLFDVDCKSLINCTFAAS